MRLLFAIMIATLLQADFYLLDDEDRIRMQEVESGEVDLSTFSKIPAVERENRVLKAMSDEEGFNHKHLDFRLATIAMSQENTTLDQYSTKSAITGEFDIDFGDISVKDGVMLQLYYHGKWYALILGEPLKILHDLFSNTDLDTIKAYQHVVKARAAYPDDIRLILYEKKWRKAYLYSMQSEKSKQIKYTYELYLEDQQDFLVKQLRDEIEAFDREFPNSSFHKELLKIERELPDPSVL